METTCGRDYLVDSAIDFINENNIMVVPLLTGSGMRIKIIEGMVLGKMVITTSIGAEGINYTDKKNYCAMGSVKSNIGHTLMAAGISGLIKTLLCLKHKKLVPTINFNQANEHIDFKNSPFYVNTELKDWKTENNAPTLSTQNFPRARHSRPI